MRAVARHSWFRRLAVAAVVVAAGLGLTACSHSPASTGRAKDMAQGDMAEGDIAVADLAVPDMAASAPIDLGEDMASAAPVDLLTIPDLAGECQKSADCDDGNAATTDTCLPLGGDLGAGECIYTTCQSALACAQQPIDPACGTGGALAFPPSATLYPPDVPQSCGNGFEIGDAEGAPAYVLHSLTAAGSRALTLDIDFATYMAPDSLIVTGIDSAGEPYLLFDSCRLQTSTGPESSYIHGNPRPADVAIRQFHALLRAGTTQLRFDFSGVFSPMYVQALGLCDFTLPVAKSVGWFSLVP